MIFSHSTTLIFTAYLACIYCQDPEVEIKYGTVRGKAVPLATGSVIHSYLGIPFARPPVGELRFEAPLEPDPWGEPFDAFEPGRPCIQQWDDSSSEDCLHMNIYALQDASDLPVMVYIHGGAFQFGANFWEPGYFFAEKGVVFVSLNYRLAVFGFAYTGDDVIPGNVGLRDNILALQFIQENIAAFGGDPDRVTIFGESAGGVAVALLMMSPLANDLFHAVIPQSGNEMNPWALLPPETEPEKYLSRVAYWIGCPYNDSSEMVECLRAVDPHDLIYYDFTCTMGYFCMGFQPVIDGEVIPDKPQELRARGEYIKVPEMIGVTEDEMNSATSYYLPNIGTEGINRTEYDRLVRSLVRYLAVAWPDESRSEDLFKALQFYYADWPYYDDPFRNRDMLEQMLTDYSYGVGTNTQAQLHSNDGLDVYWYVFDKRMSNTDIPEWQGAPHASELDPLFGWPFMELNEAATNHSKLYPGGNYSEADREFSDFMMTLWTNFAKYGNPTPDAVEGPGNATLLWPLYSESNGERFYALLQHVTTAQIDYGQKNYAFWSEYATYIAYGESLYSRISWNKIFEEAVTAS